MKRFSFLTILLVGLALFSVLIVGCNEENGGENTKTPLDFTAFTLQTEDFDYTGNEIVLGDKLNAGKYTQNDYLLTYENNVNPGKATVTITGKGNFDGSKKLNFNIIKSLSNVDFGGDLSNSVVYLGTPIVKTIVPPISTMVLGVDYTVEYLNNDGEGVATIVIKGKGDYYKGSVEINFLITSNLDKDAHVVKEYAINENFALNKAFGFNKAILYDNGYILFVGKGVAMRREYSVEGGLIKYLDAEFGGYNYLKIQENNLVAFEQSGKINDVYYYTTDINEITSTLSISVYGAVNGAEYTGNNSQLCWAIIAISSTATDNEPLYYATVQVETSKSLGIIKIFGKAYNIGEGGGLNEITSVTPPSVTPGGDGVGFPNL